MKRLCFHILRYVLRPAFLLSPALTLAACGQAGSETMPPLPESAMEAVAQKPGVSREKLARAVDALFTADDIGFTDALIVMHQGEIVAERYGEGIEPKTRLQGWSMAKTVTALAIGMLVADGRLHLDRSPPIPKWRRSGDARGEITLRQLLQMRSGLRHSERAEPVYDSDAARLLLLDGRDDMARQAEAEPLADEPGRVFRYSTATGTILADIATRTLTPSDKASTRRKTMGDFMQARLFAPLGMHSMVAEFDAAGTMIGGAMMSATARDWAKLGEFLRHGGSVKGAQIVPRKWVELMRRPSPRAPDYGAQLWLNRPSGGERDVLFADQGPASAFAALGRLGQFVIVSPEQKLTVVRLGNTRSEDEPALRRKLAAIFALYP